LGEGGKRTSSLLKRLPEKAYFKKRVAEEEKASTGQHQQSQGLMAFTARGGKLAEVARIEEREVERRWWTNNLKSRLGRGELRRGKERMPGKLGKFLEGLPRRKVAGVLPARFPDLVHV